MHLSATAGRGSQTPRHYAVGPQAGLVPLRSVLLIPLSHSAKPLLSPMDRREFSPSLSSPSGGPSAVRSPLPLTSGNT